MRRSLSLLALLLACGGPAPYDPNALAAGEFLHSLYFKPTQLVIRDQQTWNAEWPHLSGDLSAPPLIDFTDTMVLIAALGERPSSGYQVTMDNIRIVQGGSLAVVVMETRPGEGCGLLQVTTTPAQLMLAPKTSSGVVFSAASQVRNCR